MGVGGVVVRRPSTLATTTIVLVLTLAIALASCIGPGTNTHLSRLNAPNLRYLSALSGVLATDVSYFRIAAVFAQRGSTEPQVLTLYQNSLEVTGLDGRGDRLISTDGACTGAAAVSPDGLWAACVFLDTTYKLALTSLSPHGQPVQHAFALADTQPRMGPVWSPNGRYLAVDVGCVEDIFAVSPDTSQLSLVGSFTSDALVTYGACVVNSLSWSPDSAHLRLGIHPQLAYRLDDHIALAQVVAARGGTLQIPAADFAPFAAGEALLGPIRRPNDNTAVVTVNGTNGLLYYTGTNQPAQALLTMPDGAHQVLGALWTPDGRQLVLTIGSPPGCVDTCDTRAIPDVYLLTPTLST
jgi:hypothetical protein